jgi:hypothetical protein
MIRYVVLLVWALVITTVGVFAVGCETQGQNDALLGGALGAGAGAIIGHQSGHATQGALIGGAAGGAGGYIIGNEQDKKQQGTTAPAHQQETNAVTVSITNSNGSVTPVKFTRSGNNYVGPKGEVYDHLPTEAELKPAYGFYVLSSTDFFIDSHSAMKSFADNEPKPFFAWSAG